MKINYGFTSLKGEGSVFLREGNLLAYLPNNTSYYYGVFMLDEWNEPIKLVDSIIEDYDEVFVGKNYAEFLKEGKKCFVYIAKNSLIIDSEFDLNIDLDFRKLYDFNDKERFYEIRNNNGCKLIECKHGKLNYWIGIKGDIKLIKEWVEKHYSYDASRNDKAGAWVYRIGSAKKFTISFSKSKIEAKKLLKIKTPQKQKFSSFENLLDYRMQQLIYQDRVIAGLPWFFQNWTRDELISIKPYNKEFKKKRLLAYLEGLLPDGRFTNRLPNADLGSADSTGLYAYRVKQNQSVFDLKEKKKIIELLRTAKDRLEKFFLRNGLIFNEDKETWMDTIKRQGFNIEIQALYANILSIIEDEEGLDELIKNVREKFRDKIDNVEQDEVRPNIFLAYNFYPELFTKQDWKKKFRKVIDKCWLEWGGFSTIDKNSWLYHPQDKGVTDESYHNGNSWYFINNFAAIALSDFTGFNKYIKKIYDASRKETLQMGLLGCSAEITSAEQIQSRGCLFQAWSVATLIELNNKIKK